MRAAETSFAAFIFGLGATEWRSPSQPRRVSAALSSEPYLSLLSFSKSCTPLLHLFVAFREGYPRLKMLSCFLISFCFALWISVVVAQEKEAFPALNTTSDYTSLDPCQKACLDDDRAAGSYDTLDAAKQRCVDLGVQLHGVDTCLAGSLVPQCRTDDAAQVAAKSVLAAYCTSIGLQYAFNVMPTSVGGASTCKCLR